MHMIRRKIWASATCCLALAAAAQAQSPSAPKATLGAPATADAGNIARGAAPAPTPGYPQYIPRNYTVPTPPTYAAPTPNLTTNPVTPPAPLMVGERPAPGAQPTGDESFQFAADAAFPWPNAGSSGAGSVPTIPVPGSAPMGTSPPKAMPTAPMGAPVPGTAVPMVVEGAPVMTGPLVAGPINGGPILDANCGSAPFLDSGCGAMPSYWVSGEYLSWKLRGAQVPPLVSIAPAGSPGTLSDPGTAVVFGGTNRDSDRQEGFRIRAGTWLEGGEGGIDVGFFMITRIKDRFAFGSNGDPGVFRPFFNTATGAEDATLVAFIDPVAGQVLSGRVSVSGTTDFWGAEANYRTGWSSGLGGRFDILAGYRYVRYRETLGIQSDLTTAIAAGAAPAGTTIAIFDQFEAQNQFHGGQVGVVGEWQTGSMTFGLRAQIAAGVNCQKVDINGGSSSLAPGATTPITAAGGLFALPSNIGSYNRTVFSVVPEIGATVGYQVTGSLRVFGGYNVMSITNVARASEQINRNVNGTFIPDPTTGTAAGVGAPSPLFKHRDSDFYAHGCTAGLEWRW
jgi:hypothetical protein